MVDTASVAGARVALPDGSQIYVAKVPNTVTDADGRFRIGNAPAGKWPVLVQAKGFAPALSEVTAGPDTKPLEIRLASGDALVLGGEAWAQLEDAPRVPLRAGDIVIFPHGDPHRLGNGPDVPPIGDRKEFARSFSRGLPSD